MAQTQTPGLPDRPPPHMLEPDCWFSTLRETVYGIVGPHRGIAPGYSRHSSYKSTPSRSLITCSHAVRSLKSPDGLYRWRGEDDSLYMAITFTLCFGTDQYSTCKKW